MHGTEFIPRVTSLYMQGTEFIPRVTSSGIKAMLFSDGFYFISLPISREKK